MKERVKKIYNKIEDKPDVILIKNSSEPFIDENFFYVTGLEKGLFEGSIAALFSDGHLDLIVSRLEQESAYKATDANIKTFEKNIKVSDLLKESVGSGKKIGLNYSGITHKDYSTLKDFFPDVEFINISESFTKNRVLKDELELEKIKKACEIVDKIVGILPGIIKEDMFEYELAAEIDYMMQKYGADKSAFETISSFGKNSAEPHYSHGDTTLKKGDFVLCDFGANFKKYNSDTTRTFVFGKASSKQKDMYNTVLEAQKVGLEQIKPGIKAHEVHDAVNAFIDNTSFKGCFIHSTGHSLGLAVHDGGVAFSPESDIILEENMVLTVEPGVYIPGFGGVRIEDDVLIKKDGVEFLTRSPKGFIEI